MSVERNIKFLFKRAFYNLRSIKFMFWLPVLVLNVFIPIINYIDYKKYASTLPLKEFEGILQYYIFLLVPFLCVWWVIFILREYVETDGCEILYVCRARNKFPEVFVAFALFMADVSLLYIGYMKIVPDMKYSYFAILCTCMFVFGITYFLMFATKMTAISLMVNLIYVIAGKMFVKQKMIFPLYFSPNPIREKQVLEFYLPLALVGCLFVFFGYLCNRKKSIY